MSFKPPEPAAPVLPQQPAAPPMFTTQQSPGQKPQAKSSQPTFLGSGLTAQPAQQGMKSLIGSAGL